MDAQIVSTPGILGGKPRIDGTRISVELILKQLALGDSIEDLIDDYEITCEQTLAALTFAYDQLHEKHLQEVR
jgi:uncharacterized protein (DUF433 family)